MQLVILAQADGPLIDDALMIMVIGMAVVFCSLAILMGAIMAINWLWAAKPAPVVITPAPPPSTENIPETIESLDPALVALLAAAATAVIRRPVRIRGVRFVDRPDQAWAQMGRQGVMRSHRPRS